MKNLLLPLLLFSFALPTAAQEAPDGFVAGKDYTEIPRPVKTADPTKVEVVEVFWYGCIHCYRLEPALESWAARQPDDVHFLRLPAIWAKPMELHAAMYYTNQVLGLHQQMHMPIFAAMHERENPLKSEKAILKFVVTQGVEDTEKYARTLSSFGVSSQVLQAKSKMGAYRVSGTPALVINGKYQLTPGQAGGPQRMFAVANALIARERKQLAAPGPTPEPDPTPAPPAPAPSS